MSDFLQSLSAAADQNQALIDDYKGRELRAGDHVVAAGDDVTDSKTVVDTVEDTLEDHALVVTTEHRRSVDGYPSVPM